MSGLTKKAVTVDQNLGAILSVPSGTMVSYADIQKGLHEYIRKHNLRGEKPPQAATVPAAGPTPPSPGIGEGTATCPTCSSIVPIASFCDQCGVSLR